MKKQPPFDSESSSQLTCEPTFKLLSDYALPFEFDATVVATDAFYESVLTTLEIQSSGGCRPREVRSFLNAVVALVSGTLLSKGEVRAMVITSEVGDSKHALPFVIKKLKAGRVLLFAAHEMALGATKLSRTA